MKYHRAHKRLYFLAVLLFFITSCDSGETNSKGIILIQNSKDSLAENTSLFTALDRILTGIDFNNRLDETEKINTYYYINAYSGGGVAIGDLNNDGLQDIYFTGNVIKNGLYLNSGDLKFVNIATQAGVTGGNDWCTGATMGDVNNDGWLDIYVCRSFSDDNDELRGNLLFINNTDGTFTESASKYGLDDTGYSTQATFLDYDQDGDLDLYVGNNPRIYTVEPDLSLQNFNAPKHKTSDHLYQNNGDETFTDVTVASGILNYGFMLGVISGDINDDGWPDIYIANDHQEPDILYLNNKDGTFKNSIQDAVKHTSYFSMGVDLADINNDCLKDLYVVDMMAEDNYRQKTQMSSMNPEAFWRRVGQGYHYQYMRNVLQLNTGMGTFSEIGQLSGVDKTDWSWAALLADFDNDGWKDIFVTNGYKRDIKDKDAMHVLDEHAAPSGGKLKLSEIVDLVEAIPSKPMSNKFFKNQGNLQFKDMSSDAGIGKSGFSNGAAYADLDNDGDLDLVVNNMNNVASIYENNSSLRPNAHYLRLRLNGDEHNLNGIGSKVTIRTGDLKQFQELTLTRGYQSSVEPIVHFGIGEATSVDEIQVEWPDGRISSLQNIEADQLVDISQSRSTKNSIPLIRSIDPSFLFKEIPVAELRFYHTENAYDDYAKEILLPHKMSQFGPGLTTGDVDGNGLSDIYVGNAIGGSGKLFLQNKPGVFSGSSSQPWTADKYHEDIGSLLFDADGDDDLDLYIISGGNEFEKKSTLTQDRLYMNDGTGNFTRSIEGLPEMKSSGSCVVSGDYDKDGDLDLFVGGRVVPGEYPFPARSYILNNDNGKFTDVTPSIAKDLIAPGLVSSATWIDFNNDGSLDLVAVGEWMALSFFKNESGNFKNVTKEMGMSNTTGWWNKVLSADMDGDGDLDLIAGNLGLNYKYQVSEQEPLHIYCDDFDRNGTNDIVLGYYNDGTCFPVRGRQCSSEQMPMIKDKFPTYDKFALANLNDIYGEDLKKALHYEAKMFQSVYLENKGNGSFETHDLPMEAQISTIFGIIANDFDGDGKQDLLISGNFYVSEVETGRADAGTGLLMFGDGNGSFAPQPISSTGFFAPYDARDMTLLTSGPDHPSFVIVANNDGPLQTFELIEEKSSKSISMK